MLQVIFGMDFVDLQKSVFIGAVIDESGLQVGVGVYDGSKKYLYIDGALNNSTSVTGTPSTNNYAVMIGANAEKSGRSFDGRLDNVVIDRQRISGFDGGQTIETLAIFEIYNGLIQRASFIRRSAR